MEVTSRYDECRKVITITCDSREKIILQASLKHYLDLVRSYFSAEDIKIITNMIDALE